MFIMTARLSKPKLIVCALAVLAVILVVVLIVCGGKEAVGERPATESAAPTAEPGTSAEPTPESSAADQ